MAELLGVSDGLIIHDWKDMKFGFLYEWLFAKISGIFLEVLLAFWSFVTM